MKKINLIEWLSRNSHEKQTPQRFGRYAVMLLMLLTIGVGQMWATTYYYRGEKNSWNATEMTNVNGIYSYYSATSGAHQFKISTSTTSYDYNYTYVTQNYKQTDVSDIGDYGSNNCYCWQSGAHYILIFNPNTSVNSTNKPIICAATALPSAGFESDGNTISYYNNVDGDVQSSALDRADGSTIDLTSKAITSLYLKAFNTKMYQHYEVNLLGASNYHFYYKIHRTADAAGSTGFTEVTSADGYSAGSITWGSFDGSKWRKPTYYVTANQSLLTGLGSGLYTMSYYFTHEGTTETYRLPSNSSKYNQLKWKVPVPGFSTSSCTSNGTGAGTSGDPFKVAEGNTLTLTVSGTQASSDANSSLYAKFGSADYSSTLTYDLSPTTTLQSITVKAKFYNSADDLSGSEQSWTIYYQATAEPSIAISSVSPSPANSGESVTITASRQNAGTANITYQYSTNGSSWTTIGSATSSTTKSWTTPASTSTTTYYLRAQMTYNAITYTSSNATLKVYGKKTIKVKDTNNWGANFKIHRWGGDASGTEYPGETTNITSAGGQWKQVVLYSSNTDFIFCNGSSTSTADANKTANKTYAGMTDGNCYVIQSGSGASLTLTSTDCPSAPSVTTASASSVATTSATFNASGVDANNDAITDYGFKWGTTDACSSGTVTASNLGGGTSFSASKSSLTNGTTYYFKAYATNGQGTTYGSAVSVRTKYITTVTLDQEGGSDGTEEVTATEGSAMPGSKTAPGKTGYTFGGYYASAGGSGKKYYNADMTSANNWDVAASTATIHAKWTPITYTIHFNGNGNTSGTMSNQTGVTYDAATTITENAFGKTGYNFAGWATTQERANAGTVDRTDEAAHGNLTSTQGATAQLWAVWTPKQSAITFDYQTGVTGYGSSGDITNATGLKGTYDADMTALTGTMPSAAEGYAFTGFYDATSGGTKYYNADGTSAHAWDKDTESGTTLYARWEKAEITALTYDAVTVEPGATVGVRPTISPSPAGTTTICWTILHSNDSPLDPQPEMTYSEGKLTFAASSYSGTYKVQAVLRTGNACNSGTELDTETANFVVAGSHTVTVQYKCGDEVIKASTSVTGRPTAWSEEITAPDIFGYTFARWDAVDGVTIKNGDSDPVTTSTNATIQIEATYNGKLTAVYTQKSMIYFKNNLEWENVYVNFYTDSYWNNPKGSGNKGVTKQNLAMTQYGESDIWYYDYGAASITPSLYVSFTSSSQSNAENFWGYNPGINVVYPANYADDIHTNKSSENGFKAATPMFVPLSGQDPVVLNSSGGGKANYYNAGYWTKYTPGTGYRLEIYNEAGNSLLKYADFESTDDLMPMKAAVDLEGGQTYKFQIRRGGESSAGIYYGNSGTMTYENHGQDTPWDMTNSSFSMCGITSNAPGNYTFNLSYSGNSSTPPHYRLRIAVDYPVADGDYRLVYSDAVQTKPLTSAIVNKVNNGADIVSFFVRHNQTPVLRIQQASIDGSTITWNEYPTSGTPTNQITGSIASAITKDTVYNFNLSMNGSGELSVAGVEYYSGNYYIRTDAANSKWDNYRTDPDHLMTYSEYSITHGGYTHYYTHWVDKDVTGRKNVKFVIANDYSPNISDTLAREEATGTWANIDKFIEEGGDLKRSANVRFMWNIATNSISRAYVDGAQGDYSDNFLYMLNEEDGDDKIKKDDGTALTDHKVTFKDNGNWMYEANIKAQPEAQIKLLSNWGTENTITQYFRGTSDDTETLLGGSGTNWYDIRVIYDFKTNRLIAGLIPSGTIDEQMAIHADVMFVREHQGDIAQLSFIEKDSKMGAITDIETAFGVLQFNKWTINNKSKEGGHSPLVPELSRFERDMFYISFPFRVNLEEVFGFGTYGTHWIIEEYDGAGRAANGFWADTPSYWRFITNRKGKFLEPNTGYILALDLDELGESSSVWANTDQVGLYFPSYGTMPTITSSTVTYNIPEHKCNIGPRFAGGDDRRIKDSHWNVISVPTYINTNNVTFANTDWITAGDGKLGPNFLYTVNWNDNSLSARSGAGYTYKAMHAYIVQYKDNITWTTSVSPASIVARRTYEEAPENIEFRIELSQNEQTIDQTFVRLTNDENVTSGFEFNYDMSKEFNRNKANIYTMVSTMLDGDLSITETAGNCLPMTEQTTIVPMGIQIAKSGEYTISIPSGTNGVGVTLIDNETGLRTNLALEDYRVELDAATYNNRFIIEISPIVSVLTGVEQTAVSGQPSDVRKVIIDQKMYIIKDGKVYDAQGARVR